MAIDLISLNDSDNLTVNLENIADYSQSSNGIIANLATNQVLIPIFEHTEQPKILAIGDSITAGEHPVEPTPGAYRLQLKDNFVADDLNIDFIGSQINDDIELDDAEHEGHPGWTINELTELVEDGLIANYQPDIVLLMVGTNDILRSDDVSTVIADLNQLIDLIQDESPDASILVSSIAPIDPIFKGELPASVVEEVNAQLPELAEQQGEGVIYVNAGGILELEDLVDDGIHPNAAGYQEIGDAWYDALVEQDTLEEVEHITGTEFSDRLTGNDEANILFGNGGADTLTGGEGTDSFIYENLDSEIDIITDFTLEDRLVISTSGFDANFIPERILTQIHTTTGVFFSSSTNVDSIGTNASFFYETETGILSFDPDGTGEITAVEVAIFSNMPILSTKQVAIID